MNNNRMQTQKTLELSGPRKTRLQPITDSALLTVKQSEATPTETGTFVGPSLSFQAHATTMPLPPVSPLPVPVSWSNEMNQDEDLLDEESDDQDEDLLDDRSNVLLSALWWPFRKLDELLSPYPRVPWLTSMTTTECGAACLAMILAYYGYQTTTSEVSKECGVGRNGLAASDIVKAARRYGLQVRAIAVQDIDYFAEIDLPAIVFWKFNHFVIVERWSPQQVHIVDPAVGRKILTREEFDVSFTGITILLEPGPQFIERRSKSQSAVLWSYIRRTINIVPSSLLQILISSFILLIFGLAIPVTTALVINAIVPQALNNLLLTFGLGMIFLLIAQSVLTYVRSIVLIKLQANIDTSLMANFFSHLLSLPLNYFQMRSSGDILNRLESNIIIRDTANTQFIFSILDAMSAIVYLIILAWLSPVFALLALLFGSAQVILIISTNRPAITLFKSSLEAQGRSQGYLTEAVVSITTLKAAGAEDHVRSRWLRLFFAEISAAVRQSYFSTLVYTLQNFIHVLGPIVLLLVGAHLVISGSLPLGTMLALLFLVNSFLDPLNSLVSAVQQIQLAYAHIGRIMDVMNAEAEQSEEQQQLAQTPHLTGNIQLVNINFQYDLNAPPILHDINLTIEAGQKVAIVGQSGSGKSTLSKLLLGLYTPTQGEIFYDNIPLQNLNYQEVRSQFGVVMQDSGVFNGSIRENIAFNTPDIDIQKIIQAAQNAAIHDDIMRMPMDYETIVAEAGHALSGGQRQRLALARALVGNPSILLLDEATSSLDVVTERQVEHNLRNLSCTQIIIAHRLSTIRNADVILAMDQGTIIERGTHEELLKRGGFYAKLIASQLEGGNILQH